MPYIPSEPGGKRFSGPGGVDEAAGEIARAATREIPPLENEGEASGKAKQIRTLESEGCGTWGWPHGRRRRKQRPAGSRRYEKQILYRDARRDDKI
jgi:hypothetical protein